MYCPSCGTQLTQELSYCNRCGANLSVLKKSGGPKSPEKSIETFIWAIAATTISMLGIMIAVMGMMKSFRMGTGIVILFMALMFLLLLIVDGVFIWQLSRLNSRAGEASGSASQLGRFETKELNAQRERAMLDAKPDVTEDATRMFEPRYEERRTK